MSASSNIAGTFSPFIATLIITNYGWATFLHFAGSLSVIFGIIALILVTNSPEDVGFESFEKKTQQKGECSLFILVQSEKST